MVRDEHGIIWVKCMEASTDGFTLVSGVRLSGFGSREPIGDG